MYPKWKFANEIGHFVILPKLTQNALQFQINKFSKSKIHILEILQMDVFVF